MINTDAAALEARYGNKAGVAVESGPIQDLYAPGVRGGPGVIASGMPVKQGQIPVGQPVPEGVIIEQRVGRAMAPSMAVVPPQVNQGPQPSMQVVPPTGAGKTTIGTFVDRSFAGQPEHLQAWAGDPTARPQAPSQPAVSPSTSNPLASQQQVFTPQPPTPAKERKKLDLVQAILDHMHELGGYEAEACQKFYDRSQQSLKQYMKNPGAIPMECLLKFLDRKPGVRVQLLDELEPHLSMNAAEGWLQSLPNRGKTDCMLCTPILGQPTLPFAWAIGYLHKKYELGWDVQADTMIARSRNMLAKRFLDSGVKYSFWVDGDIGLPLPKKDYFTWMSGATAIPEEFTQYDPLGRLLGHSKPIVGGVYASRKYHGQLVIQPEIYPRSPEDKLLCNEIRRGTARGLHSVDWIGFGCALIHREVFLEIQRRFPQLAPQAEYAPWRFFQTEGDEGEDEAFCKRAKACGIPIWLDTQLVCAHIGNFAFLPEHTVPRPG